MVVGILAAYLAVGALFILSVNVRLALDGALEEYLAETAEKAGMTVTRVYNRTMLLTFFAWPYVLFIAASSGDRKK